MFRTLACVNITGMIRLVTGLALATALAADAADINFTRDIRPILSDKCFACHGPDRAKQKAGLRLDLREDAVRKHDKATPIVPGNSAASEVVKRIFTSDADDMMPPPEKKNPLSPREKELLKAWIEAGANYELHWAFRRIEAPPVPAVQRDAGQIRTPIDSFVLTRLQKDGFGFAPEARKEKLIRRMAFDITGLPPTLAEIDRFLNDSSPKAFERMVDDYLSRDSYGERMATEWMDVARFSDTYGYQVDRDRFVWPWRDWVIKAFNGNMPYDQFITEQLAGDLLPNATDEQILATTFNRLHPQKVEGGSVPEEFRIEYVADRTQTFGTAILGLTVECMRCHDHKYDPFTQEEYYQFSAFFDNIDEAGLYSFFTPSVPTPTLLLKTDAHRTQLAANEKEIAAAETALASAETSAAERFRQWMHSGSRQSEIPDLIGHFDFESNTGGQFENTVGPNTPATSPAANQLVKGRFGNAVQLTGDDEVKLKIGNFNRNEPFTIALWLNTPETFERSVIFHRSRAWTDAGSRGYELLLEDGRLSAALIHFYPGNAIRVQAKQALPTNQWTHVTMSYDGSSRANGLKLFVDGKPIETEIVRDNLNKQITGGGGDHITIGARFRDRGFKGGMVDEFKVFERALSELEIAELHGPGTLARVLAQPNDSKALRDYFVAAIDTPTRDARAMLMAIRAKNSTLLDQIPEIMVMREMAAKRPTYLLRRGAYDAKTQPVMATTPVALPPFPANTPRDRLGLARWVTNRENPLTARVTVNRYWQMIFGAGLVKTANDFGSQGALPSHPELLDWLAADFIAHDWNVKRLVRLMVTSTVYRQREIADAELMTVDPENKWLGRSPRNRLQAEMLRDNALMVSGLLVPKIGGPSVRPYEVAEAFKPTKPDSGDGLYRRSLYTYWKRTAPAPVMMALDAARRDVCSVGRDTTATPLQAFVFMNDPQFVEAARKLAERVWREANGDAKAACERIFRLLTSRRPNEREKRVLNELFDEQVQLFNGQPAHAREFLKIGQAKVPDKIDVVRLAALNVVATAMFSHDECVMKR